MGTAASVCSRSVSRSLFGTDGGSRKVHAAGGADGGRQRSATERRIQLEAFGQKVKKFEDEVELTASQRTRLRECFRAFDANGDGSLTVAEFCAKLGLTSPTAATMDGVATQGFLARLFRAWDTNATGGAAKVLDFYEFYLGLYNFCALPRGDFILKFTYDLYVDDNDDDLSAHDFQTLLREAMGSMLTPGLEKRLRNRFDANGDGRVTFAEFRRGMKQLVDADDAPATPYHQVVALQERLWRATGLGASFWRGEVEKMKVLLSSRGLWSALDIFRIAVLGEQNVGARGSGASTFLQRVDTFTKRVRTPKALRMRSGSGGRGASSSGGGSGRRLRAAHRSGAARDEDDEDDDEDFTSLASALQTADEIDEALGSPPKLRPASSGGAGGGGGDGAPPSSAQPSFGVRLGEIERARQRLHRGGSGGGAAAAVEPPPELLVAPPPTSALLLSFSSPATTPRSAAPPAATPHPPQQPQRLQRAKTSPFSRQKPPGGGARRGSAPVPDHPQRTASYSAGAHHEISLAANTPPL